MQQTPAYCSQCGTALEGQTTFPKCGQAMVRAPEAPDFAGWFTQIGQRLLQLLKFQEPTGTLPWQASVISLGVRALFTALIVWLVNARTLSLIRGSGAGAVSFWVFAALAVGSLAAATVFHFLADRRQRDEALTLLTDAQWPSAFGVVAAVLLSPLSTWLSLAAFAAAIAWGQALLADGLNKLGLPFTRRLLIQVLVAAAVTLVGGNLLSLGVNNLMGMFMRGLPF